MEQDNHTPIWPDAETLAAYHAQELDAETRAKLDLAAKEDPFLADALEGSAHVAFASSKESLDAKWRGRQGPSGTAGRGINGIWWASIGVGLAMVTAIWWSWGEQRELEKKWTEVLEERETTIGLQEAYADSLEAMVIDLSQPIPEGERITAARAQEVQRPELITEPTEDMEPRLDIPETLDIRSPEPIEITTSQDLAIPVAPVFYLYDLKLADVRDDRSETRFLRSAYLSGTPADITADSLYSAGESAFRRWDYEGYLALGMKAFHQDEHKAALKVFKDILEAHMDDPNALFYGGLCYYNLDRCDQAGRYLSRSERHPSRVFDQESQWFRSMLYERCGDMERAQGLWTLIVENEGFYAQKAREKLRASGMLR